MLSKYLHIYFVNDFIFVTQHTQYYCPTGIKKGVPVETP